MAVVRPSIRVFPGLFLLCLAAVVSTQDRAAPDGAAFDLVIRGGRVMDPASGLDGIRDVGIRGDRIRAVSTQRLRGRETIDARGLVVAPGFVDLHQHAHDGAAYRVEVLDGTTTAFELEEGTGEVDAWYAEQAGKALINHGVSVGHFAIRRRVMGNDPLGTPIGRAASDAATDAELRAILAQADKGLSQGAVAGILV